jgi:DNA-directed RNA polymerase subunit beta'
MGHIKLAAPVTHVWFFKGTPSKLSQLLDITPRYLEAIVYFANYLVISIDEEKRRKAISDLEKSFKKQIEEIKKQYKHSLNEVDKSLKEEVKKVSVKNREQKELIVEELELKAKAKRTSIREEEENELAKLKELEKAASEKVRLIKRLSVIAEDEYHKLESYGATSFMKVGMGAEAVLEVLKDLDLTKLSRKLREDVQNFSGQKQLKATKRLRVVEGLKQSGLKPEWMVLGALPVIPPDLRPMVQLSGGRFATSDLNDLYRRVINRNNRLKRLTDLGAPEIILRNEKRMLQEAVDALIDSTQRPSPTRAGSQVLRSLSDMLKGKQGRFRQNLLGKRVDYSGRSVIVVAPNVRLNECLVPKEMALELFKPYVLRELIFQGYAPNVKSAKHVFERRGTEVWDILESITKGHPILLNRAPTLHRLGFQAFYPVLTEGSAIGIHPSVCAGYGADFDGDQMAIHVPLAETAQDEAINLMMATNNLLRPADGEPIMTPNRDVFLGLYYLTKLKNGSNNKVYEENEAVKAHFLGHLELSEKINIKWDSKNVETSVGRIFFNQSLPEGMRFINKTIRGADVKNIMIECQNRFGKEKTVELIDAIKNLGFGYATSSGVSMSITDAEIIEEKQGLIEQEETKIEAIEKNFKRGLITEAEKARLSEEVWSNLTAKIDELTLERMSEDNSLRMIQESGARGSRDQLKQLAGMRGLVADPLGRIVELPSKGNFREGLEVYEYFTSTRGARKGLVDKALKTADAGYLTRRLVDVAHDVIIREEDCGTKEGTVIVRDSERTTPFSSQFVGRSPLKDIKDENKKVLVRKGHIIDEEVAVQIGKLNFDEVWVRSPMTCETKYGVCRTCYGLDLGVNRQVEIGTPVGVIAAQSIGEPGTQLTMRTFHLGGIVGLDITQGLPRVDEIFEARMPKTPAVMTEIPGKIEVVEEGEERKAKVKAPDKKTKAEKEYAIPAASELLVRDRDSVEAGEPLTSGHLDLKILLETKGLRAVQQYIISELQRVYESQGAPINDKHFETIVRKMSEKVRIQTPGDTSLLPGELVDKVRFAEENAKVLAEGGEPATAAVVILGITRAALYTESVLSAASFQETTSVLTDAATSGKIDYLRGLKENVIIGRLIPTGERARLDVKGAEVEEGGAVVAAEEMKVKTPQVEEKATQPT